MYCFNKPSKCLVTHADVRVGAREQEGVKAFQKTSYFSHKKKDRWVVAKRLAPTTQRRSATYQNDGDVSYTATKV